MPQTGHSTPPLSSFELERQAAIERNLFIQACTRRLAAERGRRSAILQLRGLDDRTLRDIGIHRGEIEFVVRNGVPARARRNGHQERRQSAPPRPRAA
jgi:uncharacterized protein YjiS (DUF1127 family)